MNDYSTYNNIFTMHQLQQTRTFNLARIYEDMVYEGYFSSVSVMQIIHDNQLTHNELADHFTDDLTTTPEGVELHLDRCFRNPVPECTCMPDRATHDVIGGMIL